MALLRKTLDDRVEHLWAPSQFRCACLKCGGPKQPISFLVGDATRLYTNIDTTSVLDAAIDMANAYQRFTGTSNVTVLRTTRVHGYAGGSIYTHACKSTFSVTELYSLLTFATLCRVFTVGNAYVEQVLGIPMGGHLSKIMISILLASMESNAFSDRQWLIENGFYLPVFLQRRMHPSVLFNGLRHVDDALIFSRVYCTDCLTILMHAIYRAPLQFSVESLPPVCEFLDTDVIAVDNRLRLLIRQKNQEWAAGTSDTIHKFGFPPYSVSLLLPAAESPPSSR